MRTPEHLGRDRQPQKADEEKAQVKNRLAFWREPANRGVGVQISEKKGGLKKNETRGPNGCRSAEPRKN